MAFHELVTSLFVSNPVIDVPETDNVCSKRIFTKSIERELARVDRNGHEFSLIKYEVDITEINKPSNLRLLKIITQPQNR